MRLSFLLCSGRFCLLAATLCSCSVYDPELVPHTTPDASQSPIEAGSAGHDGHGCVPQPESCNGRDDDCDRLIDEAGPDITRECSRQIQHGTWACSDTCVWMRGCDPGYFNCDGLPDNGCESSCKCSDCGKDDAGPEDAG